MANPRLENGATFGMVGDVGNLVMLVASADQIVHRPQGFYNGSCIVVIDHGNGHCSGKGHGRILRSHAPSGFDQFFGKRKQWRFKGPQLLADQVIW